MTSAGLARAQDVDGGTAATNEDFLVELKIPKSEGSNDFIKPSDTQLKDFFNLRACTCGFKVHFEVDEKQGVTMGTGDVRLIFGQNCLDPFRDDFELTCNDAGVPFQIEDVIERQQLIEITADEIMSPGTNNAGCKEQEQDQNIYLLADNNGSNTSFELKYIKPYKMDTQPPDPVVLKDPAGAEGAVALQWTNPTGQESGHHFEALCRYKGMPIFEDLPGTPEFQPACGLEAEEGEIPLEDKYFCGAKGENATDIRINLPKKILDEIEMAADGSDDKFVEVRLLVLDDANNVQPMETVKAEPVEVADFWEVYEDRGGEADAGYCFVATAAYGDYDHPFVVVLRDFRDGTLAKFSWGRDFIAWYYAHSPPWADYIRTHGWARTTAQIALWPVVFLAGAWEYTTVLDKLVLTALIALWIVRRRRRRAGKTLVLPRAALAAGAAALVLVASSHAAHAQAVWDDEYDLAPEDQRSWWAFEMKGGLYHPDVDGEGFDGPGPYQLTFGTAPQFIGALAMERYFFHPAGQLGLGASLGYFQESAKAFKVNPDGTPQYDGAMGNGSNRAEADTTTFRLFPFWLGVVYRFTLLADRTIFPLVPYAKLGLAYNIFWITNSRGTAFTAKKGSADGGTLGWSGTLGLSFRIDALDPDAARNLRAEMGVEHVGIFFEVSHADVSGLGQSKRLHTGDDFYWQTGFNFEF